MSKVITALLIIGGLAFSWLAMNEVAYRNKYWRGKP